MIEVFYLGNVDTCRVEAEIVSRIGVNEDVIAIVFDDGFDLKVNVINFLAASQQNYELDEAIARAKNGLLKYPNRVGKNPPEGLTKAGLSLWLLSKADGRPLGALVK